MKGSQEWLTTGQITATKRASSTFWVDWGTSSCCQKGEEGRSKWHIWDTYCAVWWAPPSSMELTNSGIIKLSPTRERAGNEGNSKNEWECWDVHLIVRGPVAPVCEAHDQNLGLSAMCPVGPGSRRTLMLHLFGNSRRRPLSSTSSTSIPALRAAALSRARGQSVRNAIIWCSDDYNGKGQILRNAIIAKEIKII